MHKKLIAIEGFDRCGKDTLLADLEANGVKVIKQDELSRKWTELAPDYREPKGWSVFIRGLMDDLVHAIKKAFKSHDIVVVSRFHISDLVYSKIFGRDKSIVYEEYYPMLKDICDIQSYIMLWDTYDDYLDRLKMIGDNEIQYDEDEFKKIQNEYVARASYSEDEIVWVRSDTSRIKLLKLFLSRYEIKAKCNDFISFYVNNFSEKYLCTKKLIISDCDGVLTNGKSIYTINGKEAKEYGAYDKEMIKLAVKCGWDFLFVTSDKLGIDIHQTRMNDLMQKLVFADSKKRVELINEARKNGYKKVIFIGDSLSDIPALSNADISMTTRNSFDMVKVYCDYITDKNGGEGALAEAIWDVLEKGENI